MFTQKIFVYCVQVKRPVLHVPSPPSPPEDSNDREVSMILGHSNTRWGFYNTITHNAYLQMLR